MGRRFFLTVVLVSTLLAVSFSEGFGRKELRFEDKHSYNQREALQERRAVTEFTIDYQDPGANTNPRTGYLLNPPPPPRRL